MTDYDAQQQKKDEYNESSIEELKNRSTSRRAAAADDDETEVAEGLELPGADLSDQELQVRKSHTWPAQKNATATLPPQ